MLKNRFGGVLMEKINWQDLTSLEIKQLAEEQAMVIIPTGATEQHGTHLPTGTDTIIINDIASKVASKLNKIGTKCIVAPVLTVTNSMNHLSFHGTLTLSPHTYIQVLTEYCESIYKNGFRKIVLLNGHGGNVSINEVALITIIEKIKNPIYHIGFWEDIENEMSEIVEEQPYGIMHACEGETSIMLYINGDLVKSSYKDTKEVKNSDNLKATLTPSFQRIEKISENGVIGNPFSATSTKGKKMLEIIVENLVDKLKNDYI